MAETETFDPSDFEVSEPNAVEMEPIPEGDYEATIQDVNVKRITSDNGQFHLADITYVLDDDDLRERLNLNTVKLTSSIFLDIDEEGKLQSGTNKNISLGRIRQATGNNEPGRPFSPAYLKGENVAVRIKQKSRQDNDGNTRIESQVTGWYYPGTVNR